MAIGSFIPNSIIAFLLFFSAVAMAFVGYNNGLLHKRHLGQSLVHCLLVAITLFLVYDLNHAQHGFIRLDPKSLIALRATMGR